MHPYIDACIKVKYVYMFALTYVYTHTHMFKIPKGHCVLNNTQPAQELVLSRAAGGRQPVTHPEADAVGARWHGVLKTCCVKHEFAGVYILKIGSGLRNVRQVKHS